MSTAIKIEAAASKIAHPRSSSNPTIVTSSLDSESISAPIDGQRTPADEAIFFFETSPATDAQPVQVYELQLEEDGAPSKDKAVCTLRERILMLRGN
jgi:glycogen debranching enzyme